MGVCRHEGFLALASLMLEQERGGTHIEIISECSANVYGGHFGRGNNRFLDIGQA